MGTELQYEFFKSIYDAEYQRYGFLEARARLYLTIQTFYLGAIAFKFNDAAAFTSKFGVPIMLFVAAGLLLLLGLLFTVFAVAIRSYEGPCKLNDVYKSFPQTDANFIDHRLADFAVASERFAAVNDRVASWLACASWLLVVAVFLHLSTFLWAYITQFQTPP